MLNCTILCDTLQNKNSPNMPVVVAAAAVSAAAYGAYRGSKAGVEDLKKRNRRRKNMNEHKREQAKMDNERKQEQELRRVENDTMSAKERLERFKQNMPGGPNQKKRGLFGRK